MQERNIWSPNHSCRQNGLLSVTTVVLHHTATGDNVTAEDVARYFAKPPSRVSAHDVVGKAGYVCHCVPYNLQAWHAGASRYDENHDGHFEPSEYHVNAYSVGIEICNLGDGHDPFTDEQIRSTATLIRRIERKCPNFRLRDITDHEHVSLEGKVDLKANFPAALLMWWVIHPREPKPKGSIMARLPKWAKQNVTEILA